MSLVLDVSMALARFFGDERTPVAELVLSRRWRRRCSGSEVFGWAGLLALRLQPVVPADGRGTFHGNRLAR